MMYITGDKHCNFKLLMCKMEGINLSSEDTLIILGDVGINYLGGVEDNFAKEKLSKLTCNILCVHGNHEMRPWHNVMHQKKEWNGGIVYFDDNYPNILFAEDGSIFTLENKKYITIGGAYSVDKSYRLIKGYRWFDDEQPTENIKHYVEEQLEKENWQIDFVLSHTCPYGYIPREMFISELNQSKVDNTTEEWLDRIESKLNYIKWFCGHFHTEKTVDKIMFMYENIVAMDYGTMPSLWRLI